MSDASDGSFFGIEEEQEEEEEEAEFTLSLADNGSRSNAKLTLCEVDFVHYSIGQLQSKMDQEASQVAAILDVSKSQSLALLRHIEWRKEKLIERFMDDPERILDAAGLHLGSASSLSCDKDKSPFKGACLICLEEYSEKPFQGGDGVIDHACGHTFCRSCLSAYLNEKIKAQGQVRRIPCPAHKCPRIVDDELIALIGDAALWAKYRYLTLRDFVDDHPQLKWCPSPNCDSIIECNAPISQIGFTIVPIVWCSDCRRSFCFSCSRTNHLPIPCYLFKCWAQKCADDSETANWMSVHTKDCPKCSSTIEKNGGCNHIVCRQCKHEFCWICLGSWSEHGNEYYKCNRFDESKAASDAKLDSSKGAARQALERYLFYYTRYANHEQSLKMESSLLDQNELKMEAIQKQTELTWIDLEFYRRAIRTLLTCRSALRYSYAFAYYLQRSNYSLIFEANQSDLELAVENLSALVEVPVTSSPGALASWRQFVLDKSVYVDSRLQILLDDVRSGLVESRWSFHLP